MCLFSNSQWPGGIFKNPQSELALYIVSSTENARISFEVKDEEAPIAVEKKTEREKKVTRAIEWVGLTDKMASKPADMSGGECQRTAIARAIVHEPALLLADEPTANLDAENSHNIMNILTKLNSEISTSFVFATHDEKIMSYLRRIIHLEDGKIIKDEKISKSKSA